MSKPVSNDEQLLAYVLRLGDNALITGQRMIERVAGEPGHGEGVTNADFARDSNRAATQF